MIMILMITITIVSIMKKTTHANTNHVNDNAAAPARDGRACSERDKLGQHEWGHCKLRVF